MAAAVALLALSSAAFQPHFVGHAPHVGIRPLALTPHAAASTHASRAAPLVAVATAPEGDPIQFDWGAMGRYGFAVLIQIFLISTVFGAVDLYCYGPLPGDVQLGGPLPWQAVAGIFFAMSVRSRVFSPLDNSRPELRGVSMADDVELKELVTNGKPKRSLLREACEARGLLVDGTYDKKMLVDKLQEYFEAAEASSDRAKERQMPSWTPPGVVFPIMWVLVVGPLRALSSSMVYEAATGRLNEAHLNDPVLLWLILHLCIGDTWNTVNNVEGRTGAAVPGVALVWLSTVFAAGQFYDVSPMAGLLLGLSAVWITVAGALVTDTWRINSALDAEPLYPYKRRGMRSATRFWAE